MFFVFIRGFGGVFTFQYLDFYISRCIVFFGVRLWVRDIFRGFFGGSTEIEVKLLMVFFIFSEVIFFFSFFWAVVGRGSRGELVLSFDWPPSAKFLFKTFKLPFLNTLLLGGSRLILTFFHGVILEGAFLRKVFSFSLGFGVYFFMLQILEYKLLEVTLRRRVFGRGVFIATGFHGAHVVGGRFFLGIIFYKVSSFCLEKLRGVELRLWYWHFVDVVWLLLFSIIYWWGGGGL